jgi:hypothetical protein
LCLYAAVQISAGRDRLAPEALRPLATGEPATIDDPLRNKTV